MQQRTPASETNTPALSIRAGVWQTSEHAYKAVFVPARLPARHFILVFFVRCLRPRPLWGGQAIKYHFDFCTFQQWPDSLLIALPQVISEAKRRVPRTAGTFLASSFALKYLSSGIKALILEGTLDFKEKDANLK